MTKVFFVEDTGIREFSHLFWCEACDKGTRVVLARGAIGDEPGWPDPKPEPVSCEHCQSPAKFCSSGSTTLWRRPDTGDEFLNVSDHPGACFATSSAFDRKHIRDRNRPTRTGPDDRALTVVCPNGRHWEIDGRASNCTMPDDDVHRCWVRHGRPEDGTLHVDKAGHTCGAGAGSIQVGDYHGFLHNGEFRTC